MSSFDIVHFLRLNSIDQSGPAPNDLELLLLGVVWNDQAFALDHVLPVMLLFLVAFLRFSFIFGHQILSYVCPEVDSIFPSPRTAYSSPPGSYDPFGELEILLAGFLVKVESEMRARPPEVPSSR